MCRGGAGNQRESRPLALQIVGVGCGLVGGNFSCSRRDSAYVVGAQSDGLAERAKRKRRFVAFRIRGRHGSADAQHLAYRARFRMGVGVGRQHRNRDGADGEPEGWERWEAH